MSIMKERLFLPTRKIICRKSRLMSSKGWGMELFPFPKVITGIRNNAKYHFKDDFLLNISPGIMVVLYQYQTFTVCAATLFDGHSL